MDITTQKVSWTQYAQKYDMLLQYNPFYQSLQKLVLAKSNSWQIEPGDQIADIGAGTGNYSIAFAQKFPLAQIIHLDRDEGMNTITALKKEKLGLKNIQIRTNAVEEIDFAPNTLKAVTCIHSLYTFPQPEMIIQRTFQWLKPGGQAIFVDPGRLVKVLDWQIAICTKMIKKYGLRKTLKIMKEGKEVSKQNREISKLQAQGVYWKHSHKEFCDCIQGAGFTIEEAGITFRKISDYVIARKK